MPQLVEVKARPGYHLWLRYDDGVEGEIDFSNEVGIGVFAYWNDPQKFENVRIGSSGEISWSDQIDVCGDAMYLRMTGKKPEDIFPTLKQETPHARDL